MKWLVVVALLGCQQDKKQPAPAPTPVVIPVAPDAGGAPAIDLFAAMPSTIEVSSRVANAAIKPQHIADRNLETAWNSATGELQGAWIEVAVPGATVHEIRMTVGHTGHGPKGEDYFTMNPRIREVTIIANGKSTVAALDITKRELQTIHVETKSQVRLVVTGVEPGSKRAWREIAVSELEAWGTPPAGWKPPATAFVPVVTVYEPPAPNPLDPCNGADAEREAFIKLHEHDTYSGLGGEDHNYPPRCDFVQLPDVPEGWKAAAGCQVQDEIYGPKHCIVNLERAGAKTAIEIDDEMQSAEVAVTSIDQLPAGLAIRLTTNHGDQLVVCRASPLACTAPLVVGVSDAFATKQTITADAIVVESVSGSPPTGLVGKHPLVYPK